MKQQHDEEEMMCVAVAVDASGSSSRIIAATKSIFVLKILIPILYTGVSLYSVASLRLS